MLSLVNYPKSKIFSFTLFEICISIALLGMLTSSMGYFSYNTLKQYRITNGKRAFINYLTTLSHKNCLKENHLLLLITPKKDHIETLLGGNTANLTAGKLKRHFYTGSLLESSNPYTIEITTNPLPTIANLSPWIEENNTIAKFYIDSDK